MTGTPDIANARSDMDDPSPSWKQITPHDSNAQGGPFRGIVFAVDGDLVLKSPTGETMDTIPSGTLAVGIIHPIAFGQVMAATTATGIIGFK